MRLDQIIHGMTITDRRGRFDSARGNQAQGATKQEHPGEQAKRKDWRDHGTQTASTNPTTCNLFLVETRKRGAT